MKQQFLFVLVCVSFFGCSASLVKSSHNVHTLEYQTGTLDWARKYYDGAFINTADKLCGEKNYVILEKESTPTTLSECQGLLKDYNYYWVVKCK